MTTGKVVFTFDPKNFHIRTLSVQRALEPLVNHVTTLVKNNDGRKKKKGKSKKSEALVAALQLATRNFIEKGEQIAREYPDFQNEMMTVVQEVRDAGDRMTSTALEFTKEPCSSEKRTTMVQAARDLLLAVTKLLTLADMIDAQLLLSSVRVVQDDLENVRNANNQADLMASLKALGASMSELLKQASNTQKDVRHPLMRDEFAGARATLLKYSPMLMQASKIYINDPGNTRAKSNRDFFLKEMCESVDTISDIVQGKEDDVHYSGELAGLFDKFKEEYKMDPAKYNEIRTRPNLEKQLDEILNQYELFAQTNAKGDERKQKIFKGCDAVRQALQGLLQEYMLCSQTPDRKDDLENAFNKMDQMRKNLDRQVRKAVVDQTSDQFLDPTAPLQALIKAAESGNKNNLDAAAEQFLIHAKKLVEVANLACCLSTNEEGVQMVKHAAGKLEKLAPGVVNAARMLAEHPNDPLVQDNMNAFKNFWEKQLEILTEAVDEITTVDDFLSVSENLILEDVNKCLLALQDGDSELLAKIASAITDRAVRVCRVVTGDMDNYEPCIYTRKVMEAVKVLRNDILARFGKQVSGAVDALNSDPVEDVDENEFIDVSRLVFDGVRDVRRAVLMNRANEELDPDEVDFVDDPVPQKVEEIPIEHREKIQMHVENFHSEKRAFDKEIDKWDEGSNDIIVLAKYMCNIMIGMTDYARQTSSLKTMTDVIGAAQKLSEAGTKMNSLVKPIGEQCPDSTIKSDISAYLERIDLYCKQIKITSKVKADVKVQSGDELILSDLESAASLIQAAKNLMNAVIQIVKSSYIACTKYQRHVQSDMNIVWKMKLPEMKPLVRINKPGNVRVVRRDSRRIVNPSAALAEFQIKDIF